MMILERMALSTLLFLVLPLIVLSEKRSPITIHWRKSTPLPEARAGYAAGILDGRLVIAGGTYWEGAKGRWVRKGYTTRTDVFDPGSEKWTRLPDMPTPLGYSASVAIGQRLYVLGGYTGTAESQKVYILEKTGDKYAWSESLGRLPRPKVFARALRVGNSIALLGGTTRFEPYDASGTCCTSQSATRDLLILDPRRPEHGWQPHPSFPGHERWLFCAESDGMSIWVAGGIDQKVPDGPTTHYEEVWRYDSVGKAWSRVATLPHETHGRTPITSAILDGRLLLVSFARRVWELNLSTMEFTEQSPLPEEAFVDQFFLVNDQILGAGGENKMEGPRRRSEWTFIGEFKQK